MSSRVKNVMSTSIYYRMCLHRQQLTLCKYVWGWLWKYTRKFAQSWACANSPRAIESNITTISELRQRAKQQPRVHTFLGFVSLARYYSQTVSWEKVRGWSLSYWAGREKKKDDRPPILVGWRERNRVIAKLLGEHWAVRQKEDVRHPIGKAERKK